MILKITQKGIFQKPLTRQVLLGRSLSCGVTAGSHLIRGKTDAWGMTVYHPAHIGRGILIEAHPQERERVILHLGVPCTAEDIQDFLDIAYRVSRIWSCEIEAEGKQTDIRHFQQLQQRMNEANLKILHESMQNVLDGGLGCLVLNCALFPLTFGKKEAEQFWAGTDTSALRDWMHAKQSIKAVYADPDFICSRNRPEEITGVYVLKNGTPFIFPKIPMIPLNCFDKKTNSFPIQVKQWRVSLYDAEQKKELAVIAYEDMIRRLPAQTVSEFDSADLLVQALSAEQLKEMARPAEAESEEKPAAGETSV